MYSHRPGLDVRSHAVQEPYRLTYSVAAHGVAGQSRDIEISDEYHDQACGWQIAQVTGLDADRPLPAHSVRLSSRDGAPGKVVFAITFGQGNCTNYPPSYLETTPDEAPLKAQLGGVP